ncbi:hypothetical protein NC652_019314, partial [Populus alba x Populus x berolinensis]
STRENQSSFGLSLTSGCTYRYCPHKSERWKHGTRLMATVLGDRYGSCSNYNFLCSSSDGNCSRGQIRFML